MTNQEIFDKAWDHFIVKGNKRSFNPDPQGDEVSCLYRGPNGTKCAVGILIPDDKYHPNMEGQIPSTMPDGLLPDGVDYNFLGELQLTHDSSIGDYITKQSMVNLANEFGLKVNDEWVVDTSHE